MPSRNLALSAVSPSLPIWKKLSAMFASMAARSLRMIAASQASACARSISAVMAGAAAPALTQQAAKKSAVAAMAVLIGADPLAVEAPACLPISKRPSAKSDARPRRAGDSVAGRDDGGGLHHQDH